MRYYNVQVRRTLLQVLAAAGWPSAYESVLRAAPLPGWLVRHTRIDYIVQANLSMVEWRDRHQIRLLRAHATLMTRMTGERHVVDHRIPLTHPQVCGLTVHENLCVTTYAFNATKRNKWPDPNQLELAL